MRCCRKRGARLVLIRWWHLVHQSWLRMLAASLAEHNTSIGELVIVHVLVFDDTVKHAALAIQTVEII
jgi:hypothetical protein